jgi:hypothetical protein
VSDVRRSQVLGGDLAALDRIQQGARPLAAGAEQSQDPGADDGRSGSIAIQQRQGGRRLRVTPQSGDGRELDRRVRVVSEDLDEDGDVDRPSELSEELDQGGPVGLGGAWVAGLLDSRFDRRRAAHASGQADQDRARRGLRLGPDSRQGLGQRCRDPRHPSPLEPLLEPGQEPRDLLRSRRG